MSKQWKEHKPLDAWESTESTVTSVEASSGVKLCAAACIVPVVIIITLRAAELFEFYS